MFILPRYICFVVLISIVSCLIQDEPMPREFYECYLNQTSGRDITTMPSYSVQVHCLNYYWTKTHQDRFHTSIDPSVLNWIQTLDRNLNLRRQKRQARGEPLRRRREIRTLSDRERRAFFDAIVALKQDTSIRPNMYDAIAGLHNAAAVQSAHFGPNFLGWHRYYLYIFEEALLFKDPSVTLPYWDSTMDFNMDVEDPVDSVMWSDIFLGNGDGLVTSGPFANWRTTNNALLERNIGSPGSLMTPNGVAAVLSQTFHRDITQPTATGLNDLEGLHNNVHAWIAGNMNGLTTSAYDPVFFLHHCYIDYVWEQFRFQQFSRGINPQNDFPNTGVEGHWPWSTMVNLGRIRNVDGYHNAFTQFVYEYESSPTCPDCGNSPYLECDSTRQVCVSTATRAVQSGGPRVQNRMNFGAPVASLMRNNQGQGMPFRANSRARTVNAAQEKFIPNFIDPRTQKNAGRVKRAVYNPKLAAAKARLRLSTPNNNVLLTSRVSSNDPFSRSIVTINTPFGNIKSSVSNGVNPSLNVEIPSRRSHGSSFRSGLPNTGKVPSNSGRVLSASRQSPFNTRGPGIRTRPTNTRSNSRSMNSIDTNSITRSQGIGDNFRVSHRSRFLDFAIQNSFCLDGIPDVSRWAFAPIKIIYVRPPGSSFNCKIIKDGRIVEGQDFYSPTHYSDLQQQVRTGNPASYEKPVRSGSGASKVFVQSDGLSYEGKYIDYAIIDERQPISETVTYVAFKNPNLGTSKAYISAYDANGRICQPRCLVHGSNPPRYKECSGVISVTDSLPRMYGNTYGEAVMNRYSFDDRNCPKNKDHDIYLTFYCDYENQWPWINYPHH